MLQAKHGDNTGLRRKQQKLTSAYLILRRTLMAAKSRIYTETPTPKKRQKKLTPTPK